MSMDALIGEVLGQVRTIAEDVVRRTGVRLRTATVTGTDPLRIRYDGEDDASVVTPRRLARVAKDDRVVVAKSRGQATILGVLGGPSAPGWPESITYAPGMDKAGHGFNPRVQRDGRRRYMRGRFGRVGGAKFEAGKSWTLGTLSPEDRPTQVAGGIAQVAEFASTGYGRVEIKTNGDIVVGVSKATAWVGVDSITWDVD